MNIITENCPNYKERIPQKGKHILAYQADDALVVYQAFNPQIANYAVAHQAFGGEHYRYSRMSWIKPNFLWMMYRCGWAQKKAQTQVLAIWIKKTDFDIILANTAYSSFQPRVYASHEDWRADLGNKRVRLQWDSDHDPWGNKEARKAIQLGLKGDLLEQFGKEMILKIENITNFVQAQKKCLDLRKTNEVQIPTETIYQPADPSLSSWLGLV